MLRLDRRGDIKKTSYRYWYMYMYMYRRYMYSVHVHLHVGAYIVPVHK